MTTAIGGTAKWMAEAFTIAIEKGKTMSDYIKRENAISLVQHSDFDTEDDKNYIMLILGKEYGCQSEDVAPVRHEEDGTLWVTVADCENVGRVIIKNEKGHFCRVFYMGDGDEEPVRHGRWEDEFKEDAEAFVKHRYVCTVCGEWQTYGKTQYCPSCGAKMDEGGSNGTDD